jgi:hypothetical protein
LPLHILAVEGRAGAVRGKSFAKIGHYFDSFAAIARAAFSAAR